MSDGVFICHASEDAAVARDIVVALEQAGVPCWIAPRNIHPGENYTQAILEGLAAAPALVLVFSAATNASPHVHRELETAVSSDTAIVPVRVRDAEPSPSLRYFIGTSQWLDLGGRPAPQWLAALVDAVKSASGRPGTHHVPPARSAKTPAAVGTPVPAPRGRTWGREDLCRQVAELVGSGGRRLVTLTGLGGIGKSRVAHVVAHELQGSGRAVRLLPATESSSTEHLADAVDEFLAAAPSDALLVLDDLEDLDDPDDPDGAAGLVAGVLERWPAASLLVTSRLPLGVAGEHQVPVPPLAVPGRGAPVESIIESPAVQLLMSSAAGSSVAARVAGQEEQVADLCRLLDGVPLALELAAARLPVLGVDRLHAGLASSLELLSTTSSAVPARQRTLQTTIAWTVERLDPRTRQTCERLAVFEGAFSLEAAEAVCAGTGPVLDALSDLVAMSLVRVEDTGPTVRYALPATVRTFLRAGASEEVAAGARTALAAHLLAEVRARAGRLDTADGSAVLAAYEADAADLDAAIDAAVSDERLPDAVELTLATAPFWVASGRLSGALDRVRRVLAALPADSADAPRLHVVAGRLAYHLDDLDVATDDLRTALSLAGDLGDEVAVAEARCYLAAIMLMTGSPEEGADLAQLALADSERLNLYPLAAEALGAIAISHAVRGDFDSERAAHERLLDVVRRHGDLARTANALNTLAEIAMDEDDVETARSYATESLSLARERLPLMSRDATITLARAAAAGGQAADAAALVREVLVDYGPLGQDLAFAQCLRVGGCLATADGRHPLAMRLFAAAQGLAASPNGTDTPVENDFASALTSAREQLGAERSAHEWRLGESLPLTTMLTHLEDALQPVTP